MPDPNPSSPRFWKCRRCGTPNPWAAYLTNCVGCGAPRPAARTSGDETADEEGLAPISIRAPKLSAVSGAFLLVVVAVYFGMKGMLGFPAWLRSGLLLSPRCVFLAPAVILPALAIWKRARVALAINLAAILFGLVFPMNLGLPLEAIWASPPKGLTVRLMSYNRGRVPIDAARFIKYVESQKIDVICFQEAGDDPALDAYFARGWHVDKGKHFASRFPIVEELPRTSERNDDQERYTMTLFRVRLRAPSGEEFLAGSAHLPTLRPGIRGLLSGRPGVMSLQTDWWRGEFGRFVEALSDTQEPPLIVGGDLNMPSDEPAIAELRAGGFHRFAFDEVGWGWAYTRPSAFPWVRIDHILAGPEWTFTKAWVAPDFGSDHLPVVSEAILPRRFLKSN